MLVAARRTWMKTFGKALVNFWYRYISHCDSCPVGLSLHFGLSSLLGNQHRLEGKFGTNRTQKEFSKLCALWDDDDDDLWLPERHFRLFFFQFKHFFVLLWSINNFSHLKTKSYSITVPRWVLVTFLLFCLCRPFFLSCSSTCHSFRNSCSFRSNRGVACACMTQRCYAFLQTYKPK